jgi:hypothetical protein
MSVTDIYLLILTTNINIQCLYSFEMNILPLDIYTDISWEYLHVDVIRRLCSTNIQMRKICDNPETWRYLLKRDYKIQSTSSDPEREYLIEERYRKIRPYIMDYISKNYDFKGYSIDDAIAKFGGMEAIHDVDAEIKDLRDFLERVDDDEYYQLQDIKEIEIKENILARLIAEMEVDY